jgi:acetoacetyl-CoA reductase
MKKLALVTGGTRGIGEAIAKKLQQDGCEVIATYIGRPESAEAFTKATGIKTYKFDVAYFESCKDAIEQIEKDYGRSIDIVINNAGITKDRFIHKMSPDEWNAVINTNLNSCFNITRNVIEKMREKKFGRIISISSINGLKGQIGQANVIAPGYVGTDMVKKIDPTILQGIVSQIPVGRLAEPTEIAALASYLAGDSAGFITGATFSINGGQYMQ